MASIEPKPRPNIRVEIHNNLAEPMETDEIDISIEEEGEIVDEEMPPKSQLEDKPTTKKELPITRGTFMTGIDIFDKEEQLKLQERAKRFQLNPNEINNFTDENLQQLYLSLGITPENEDNVRFEAIHMLGVNGLSAENILNYFAKYAPNLLEWISHDSCNVVWLDKVSAARALHFISKIVKGMPIRICPSFDTDLLKNKDRLVELSENFDDNSQNKLNLDNAVDVSEITIPVPPGYWRLGEKIEKSKCLLMRFSFKTDKKPFKIEQFSWFNKKQLEKKNVPIIRNSIFDRNKHIKEPTDKNPWGSLARNWDGDAQYRERDRIVKSQPKIQPKDSSILVRLGSKNKSEIEDSSDEEEVKKISKIPRMRMYADEEEEKIKRKRLLQTIKQQYNKISEEESTKIDLRSILGITNRKAIIKTEESEESAMNLKKMEDLGTKLKNRNKKMIFEVTTDIDTNKKHDRKKDNRQSRHHHKSKRDRSPIHRRFGREDINNEDNDYNVNRTRSKVAVVIKKQPKPVVASTVAPTVWSRINRFDDMDKSSDSDDSDSNSSTGTSSISDVIGTGLSKIVRHDRPGFISNFNDNNYKTPDHMSQLKIEINNDHFKN